MIELFQLIDALQSLEMSHACKANKMISAFNGILYHADLLALAVLNRYLDLLQGFCLLMRVENYLAAAPLVRLQLDNLLRFNALWLVSDPHAFAMEVMKGTPIRELKCKQGKKMSDNFLVKELQKSKPWVENVYKQSSGFVHLSEKHILSLLNDEIESGDKIEISIGRSGEKVPIEMKIQAISVFNEITNEILVAIERWIIDKQKPDFLANLKESRYPANVKV